MAVISRLKVDHPALGTTGGSALHAQIEGIYKKIGDNSAARFFVIENLNNSESIDLDHNFNVALTDLRFDVYQVNVPTKELIQKITAATMPSLDSFTIVAKVGEEKIKLSVTNDSAGAVNLAVLMWHDPIYLSDGDIKDIDIKTVPPQDGQALVFDAAAEKWKAGASGDASLKIQAVESNGTTTLKGGYVIDDSGRELATYAGTGIANTDFGIDLVFDLDLLNSTAIDSTTYYLYIDTALLPTSITTDQGRILSPVTSSELVLKTETPEAVNLERFMPLGFVRRDVGAWGAFGTLAFRRHQRSSVVISPIVATPVNQQIGTVGSAGQLEAGHVLTDDSFSQPSKAFAWNLSDASAAVGNVPLLESSMAYTDSGIFGSGTATFDGSSTTYLSSTSASLAPSSEYSYGGWFLVYDWAAPNKTLISQDGNAAATDICFRLDSPTGGVARAYHSLDGTQISGQIVSASSGFLSDGWHHIASTYNGSEVSLYVDGVLADSVAAATIHTPANPLFKIGSSRPNNLQPFVGKADEVFLTTYAMDASEIYKLYSARVDLAAPAQNVALTNRQFHAYYNNSLLDGWLIDQSKDHLYVDFGEGTDTVKVAIADGGLGASSVPVRNLDQTLTSVPAATIPHGLPALPTNFSVLHDELADGKWATLDASSFLKADDTNIYTNGFDLLTIDATHPLRIIASVGVPSIGVDSGFLEKSSAYTAKVGDKILADTSGGVWTLTLPPSAGQGAVIEIFDSEGTFGTNNLTVDPNGQNIDGSASDLLLDVSATTVKLVFINSTQGWRVY